MTIGATLTNNGKKVFLDRAFNNATTYTVPSTFKIGINNGTPNVADTDLTRPFPITGTELVDSCDVTTGWTGGTDSVVALNITNFIEGVASISLSKTGTAGSNMSMSKTTTSLDFTNKTFWVYCKITAVADFIASGTAIQIQFGSDSSNYYSYNIPASSLVAGGQWFYFTTVTASSTTGSPVISACDFTKITCFTDLSADTIAANRVLFDSIMLASSGDYIQTFVSGFPSIDLVTRQVTIRGLVLDTQANGANLNGFVLSNTDATPLILYEVTHTATSKDPTDQIAHIAKFKYT